MKNQWTKLEQEDLNSLDHHPSWQNIYWEHSYNKWSSDYNAHRQWYNICYALRKENQEIKIKVSVPQ